MRKTFLFGSLLASVFAFGQWTDTLTLVHYNLLNYRNSTNQCNGNTNSSSNKEKHLRTIINYAQPSIFTVNEMGSNLLNVARLKDNVMNADGRDHYDHAEYSNNGFSSLVNMIYFDTRILGLHGQWAIEKDLNGSNLVRVIDHYQLFLKKEASLLEGDTTFLHVFVAHLKASSSSSDKQQRARATEAMMDYIDKKQLTENVFLAGDLNVQSGSEESFENLVEYSDETYRFYDPKNAVGPWNNNSSYKNLHTQSTRASNTNGGCFSGGGMDDRFDFILASDEVVEGSGRVRYVDQSYWAIGNDGRRLNNSITAPNNNSVPAAVATALYEVSDHLPVLMKATYLNKTASIEPGQMKLAKVYPNPADEGFQVVWFEPNADARLMDASGRTLPVQFEGNWLNTSGLEEGIYFLSVITEGRQQVIRIVISHR
jgi:hypothetical protein